MHGANRLQKINAPAVHPQRGRGLFAAQPSHRGEKRPGRAAYPSQLNRTLFLKHESVCEWQHLTSAVHRLGSSQGRPSFWRWNRWRTLSEMLARLSALASAAIVSATQNSLRCRNGPDGVRTYPGFIEENRVSQQRRRKMRLKSP